MDKPPYELTRHEEVVVGHMLGMNPNDDKFKDFVKAGFEGGRWKSAYSRFDAESQGQWLLHLMEHFLPYRCLSDHEAYVPYGSDWAEIVNITRESYTEHRQASMDKLKARYAARVQAAHDKAERRKEWLLEEMEKSEDPAKYAEEHAEIEVRPRDTLAGLLFDQVEVIDVHIEPRIPEPPKSFEPWDGSKAEWVLDNLTQYMLFALHFYVLSEAREALEYELIELTESSGDDTAKATRRAFALVVGNLDQIITDQLHVLKVGTMDGIAA